MELVARGTTDIGTCMTRLLPVCHRESVVMTAQTGGSNLFRLGLCVADHMAERLVFGEKMIDVYIAWTMTPLTPALINRVLGVLHIEVVG